MSVRVLDAFRGQSIGATLRKALAHRMPLGSGQCSFTAGLFRPGAIIAAEDFKSDEQEVWQINTTPSPHLRPSCLSADNINIESSTDDADLAQMEFRKKELKDIPSFICEHPAYLRTIELRSEPEGRKPKAMTSPLKLDPSLFVINADSLSLTVQ